jgi:hypothetical protein
MGTIGPDTNRDTSRLRENGAIGGTYLKRNDPFLSSLQRIWLIGLAGLWALFLFGGFLFGAPDDAYSRRMPTWTRMVSSVYSVRAAWEKAG